MTRPKPKSTINDLLIFFLIGYIFCQHTFHYQMQPAAQLMFSVAFLILSIFKLRHDKLNENTTTAAYVIMAISLVATIFFTLITINLNNSEFRP